ncbi:hypothetical protein [Coprobacter tertius]|nr:hypothetical protein [Coprobacter tertius]
MKKLLSGMKNEERKFSSKQGSNPSNTAKAAPHNMPKTTGIYFQYLHI